MAIFQRISDLFKSNVNDLIDRAEDPEKMVKQIIIDMEEQVRDATQALGQAMGSEKQALKQLNAAKQSSADWEAKAKMALQSGNQELAKKALANKVAVDNNIATFEQSYNTISTQVAELKDRVATLRSKLEEARTRQNMLIARAKMADAQKNVATSLSGTDTTSAFSKLEKMERKVEGKESEAEAFAEMSGDTTFAKDEFKELETNNAVDEELARLMAEMNK
jgi:phage shock protein A